HKLVNLIFNSNITEFSPCSGSVKAKVSGTKKAEIQKRTSASVLIFSCITREASFCHGVAAPWPFCLDSSILQI
ncbi:MAG: hypothetical protein ACM3P0_15120, partial [Acidobacteriota bacterium]